MPELPEVETVARVLREGRGAPRGAPRAAPSLLGRTIQSVKVLWPPEIGNLKPRAFVKQMVGLRVQSVGRRGKYLMIGLMPQVILLIHLKMSGRLDVVPQAEAFTKHARVVWLLDEGLALRFDDPRKFGRVYLTDDPETVTHKLGPDALNVTTEEFTSRLLSKRGALKPLLLDQTFIAGVGNIYADESLHIAKLHPKRTANSLTEQDAARLHTAIREVLLAGIEANGASFDWVYPGGNFQENFKVYGLTGKACQTCGRPIQRILVGQRSTHFCSFCQPLA